MDIVKLMPGSGYTIFVLSLVTMSNMSYICSAYSTGEWSHYKYDTDRTPSGVQVGTAMCHVHEHVVGDILSVTCSLGQSWAKFVKSSVTVSYI